jgi:hypothetical protein
MIFRRGSRQVVEPDDLVRRKGVTNMHLRFAGGRQPPIRHLGLDALCVPLVMMDI